MPVGDVTDVRIIVTYPVFLQFGKNLPAAVVVKMIDARSAAGGHCGEALRVKLEKVGDEWTVPFGKMSQDKNLVLKSFFRHRTVKLLRHFSIEAYTNGSSQGVLDCDHDFGGEIAAGMGGVERRKEGQIGMTSPVSGTFYTNAYQ